MRCLPVLPIVFVLVAVGHAQPSLLLTADNEGHVGPCASCPVHVGRGGLARRATVVAAGRAGDPNLLLLDAGNFLFGPESSTSGGRVIAIAYDALGYDAVNLSYRDLRPGKAPTLELLKGVRFEIVSANLLDDSTGQPLVKPYVVRSAGGKRVAILGLTDPPAGWQHLPELKQQLAGVRVVPAADALESWLPKARAESDYVVALYYGRPSGLAKVRQKAGDRLTAIGVGGLTEDEVGPPQTVPVVYSETHGKSVARLSWTGGAPKLEQLPVSPDVAADPSMARTLEPYAQAPLVFTTTQIASTPATSPSQTQPSATDGGHEVALTSPNPPMTAPTPPSPPVAPPAVPPVPHPDDHKMTTTRDAAPRVAARSALTPRGLAGVGLNADAVNHAIETGRDLLWKNLQAELAKEKRPFGQDAGVNVLEALALVHSGAQIKYPAFDAMLRNYLDRLDPVHDSLSTYQMGIICMLIGDYAEPKYLPKMRLLARSLVEQQLADGSWHYGRTVPDSVFGDLTAGPALSVEGGVPLDDPAAKNAPAMIRSLPFEKHDPGDNSTSQFAMLGLRAAARVRVQSSPELWRQALKSFNSRRCDDGGWGYEVGALSSYGSMTCAGICSIAIARYELQEKEPAVDPAIETGLGWLDSHFSVSTNPGSGAYIYYYLYSLERVGRILGTEFIGSHEWYPLGAQFLVTAQRPDGAWLEQNDGDPRAPTSFALLFLTRATQSLNVEIRRGGDGEITTSVATPPPARLYVILDASGSMLDDMDGRQKFDIARDAVSAMFAGMPDSSEVALRVYGHRLRSNQPGSDEDTKLEYPMAKIDRPKLAALLKSLRSRGKTPLALSLEQAKQDLSSYSGQPVTVVLLTDGGEDTMPRRNPVKAAAEFATLPGVTFHIVGFDINQEDWGLQLHAMADAAKGRYWPAARAKALERELRSAVFGIPDDFTLYDASQTEVARGAFGDARRLPEGKYLFKTQYAGKEFKTDVWVNTDAATGVVFDANKAMPAPKPTTAPSAAPPAVARRFCTHCGHALPTGAKFCPGCGQPVAP